MNNVFDITYDHETYKTLINEDNITNWLQAILKEVDYEDGNVSLVFTDNERIRELNRDYLNRDYATDVLSFSQIEGEFCNFKGPVFLGDIVISIPVAEDQAREKNHDFEIEIKFLLLHGILHLIGYDHDEEYKGEMNDLENKIFYKLTGVEIE